MKVLERIRDLFGLDDDFVRELPPRAWRTDLLLALLLTSISITALLANRQLSELWATLPLWPSAVAVCTQGVLITFRRRFPVLTMILNTGVHFLVVGVTLVPIAMLASSQVAYFLTLYTAVAFARRRDALLLSTAAVLLGMAIWLVVEMSNTTTRVGAVNVWYWIATVTINAAYFGAAIWLGRISWLKAKALTALEESNALVRAQANQLMEQAILKERLRIARDLHDSVAHYISLIGIQTGAVRRAMDTKPEAAAESLRAVEEMSRQAVTELRTLLGSLREGDTVVSLGASLEGLGTLCESLTGSDVRVTYELVGDPSDAASLSPAQTGTLLRITQEAITNTRRHSTARHVRVVVRLTDQVELEITDDGHPVPGTGGTGMGLVGMRERVWALGGTIEAGPRATQGFRILARLPRYLGSPQERIVA